MLKACPIVMLTCTQLTFGGAALEYAPALLSGSEPRRDRVRFGGRSGAQDSPPSCLWTQRTFSSVCFRQVGVTTPCCKHQRRAAACKTRSVADWVQVAKTGGGCAALHCQALLTCIAAARAAVRQLWVQLRAGCSCVSPRHSCTAPAVTKPTAGLACGSCTLICKHTW